MTGRLAVALIATSLLAGACGGAGPPTPAGQPPVASTLPAEPQGAGPPTQPATTGAAPARPAAPSVLPDLVVDDVGAGVKVNLASLVPSTEPLLIWLWAPH